jgi:cellulose synthase/poly-beta-1,6-N-acetylglucosamine synthase-like glycosyltransferase
VRTSSGIGGALTPVAAVALAALAVSIALVAYTYIGYPSLLKLAALFRPPRRRADPPSVWPPITITIPVYNEAGTIAETLSKVLAIDYPLERRQILVVSDASTDGTDDVVRTFADRGVELLRMPVRRGKTAAENAALRAVRGEIIVNTDASIHIPSHALRPLIAAFGDPSVGVASGRDVSITQVGDSTNQGESRYVGYEMWVRKLETDVAGIVGASGCFYAIRAELHQVPIPDSLSRDFASAMVAEEHGLRAVSVPEAICFVPRTKSLRNEFRRKVRTMTRGMQTLAYKRHLLDPTRHGLFAWMLFSHKVCRWLVPWAGVVAVAALGGLSLTVPWVRWLLAGAAALLVAAAVGWGWPERRAAPRLLAIPAYLVSGNAAALLATIGVLRGQHYATWEPTRRATAVPR